MKLLKLGLISLVIMFLLVLGISFLFPSHIRISRAVNINIPKDSALILVANMRTWENWNEFTINPSVTSKKYTDNSFTSDQLQVMRQEVRGDTVTISWKQHTGRTTEGGFTFYSTGSVTVVQWYFDFHLHWYPWEKFSSLLFESQLGVPMEKSLNKLKDYLEPKP
jgi:hypothetical protein